MDKGGYTPHEPFRSHQDWEGSLSSLVVEPVSYMMTFTRASLTCPGLSFPSRTGLSVPACGRPAGPRTYRRSCSRPRGKGAEPLCPPHPLSQRLRAPDHHKKEIDRQTRALEPQPAFGKGRHTRLFTAPPQNNVSAGLCRATRVYVTPNSCDAVLKERRQNHHSQPSPRHAANTQSPQRQELVHLAQPPRLSGPSRCFARSHGADRMCQASGTLR
jgi:hypothetical protein